MDDIDFDKCLDRVIPMLLTAATEEAVVAKAQNRVASRRRR
jgi:hypothetical protein